MHSGEYFIHSCMFRTRSDRAACSGSASCGFRFGRCAWRYCRPGGFAHWTTRRQAMVCGAADPDRDETASAGSAGSDGSAQAPSRAAGGRVGSAAHPGRLSCGFWEDHIAAAWREAEAARKPVAWLTLDEGDDDPVVLWSYVIEALRRVCPAIGQSASPQTAGAASIVDVVLPRLVNELDDQGEVALILDDFHRLSDGAARESVAWFIGHVPSTFQLVLSTRVEPAIRWLRYGLTVTGRASSRRSAVYARRGG